MEVNGIVQINANAKAREVLADFRFAGKYVSDNAFAKVIATFWAKVDPSIVFYIDQQEPSADVKQIVEQMNILNTSQDQVRVFVERILYPQEQPNNQDVSFEDSIEKILLDLKKFD